MRILIFLIFLSIFLSSIKTQTCTVTVQYITCSVDSYNSFCVSNCCVVIKGVTPNYNASISVCAYAACFIQNIPHPQVSFQNCTTDTYGNLCSNSCCIYSHINQFQWFGFQYGPFDVLTCFLNQCCGSISSTNTQVQQTISNSNVIIIVLITIGITIGIVVCCYLMIKCYMKFVRNREKVFLQSYTKKQTIESRQSNSSKIRQSNQISIKKQKNDLIFAMNFLRSAATMRQQSNQFNQGQSHINL